MKVALRSKAPKTVNNVLTTLNVLMRQAVEWDLIERVPCVIRLLPIPKPSAQFHDFDAFERLVEAAGHLDRQVLLLVLMGGEGGLRCGEMMALEWQDVDLEKRQVCVQRSEWKGHVTTTKGGRIRYVPLTARLTATLTSTVPVAQLAARLCSVFPDGTSALVTRGLVNLSQRTLGADPSPLTPGEPVEVELELEATSWIFEEGHRLRLALAGAEWPNAWPPPEAGTLELADVRLTLPVVDGPPAIAERPAFTPSPGVETHGPSADDGEQPTIWRTERDVLARETRCVISHGVDYEGHLGSQIEERYAGEVGVSTVDPGRAWAVSTARYRVRWPEADVVTEARLELRSDAKEFHVVVDVVAGELDGPFGRRERRFERRIPRDLA